MRRRLRFLRKARELAYRDLGGLVYNLHRFGRRNDALVLAKLDTIGRIDTELRALESALSERQSVTVISEAGVAACPRCAAIHGSDDRFCPNCGLAMDLRAERPVAGPQTAPTPPPPPASTPMPTPTPAMAPTAAHTPAPAMPATGHPAPAGATPAPATPPLRAPHPAPSTPAPSPAPTTAAPASATPAPRAPNPRQLQHPPPPLPHRGPEPSGNSSTRHRPPAPRAPNPAATPHPTAPDAAARACPRHRPRLDARDRGRRAGSVEEPTEIIRPPVESP